MESPSPVQLAPYEPVGGVKARARSVVVIAGIAAAAAQVLVVRELLVASAGNELSIAAVLAAWLAWSAVGCWLGGRAIARSKRTPTFHIGALAVTEALLLFLAVAAARAGLWALQELAAGSLVRAHLVPAPGGALSLPQLLLLATLVVAPVGLALGWQFAAGCALMGQVHGPGRGAPGAYILDALGHLVGGAALSLVVVTRVPAEWTLLVAVAMLWFAAWSLRPVAWRAILGFLLLAAIGLMVPGFRAQTLAWRWAPHRLVASHDGPFGNTSVLETGGERAFFVNGVHAFETGAALAGEQWVDLPLLAHPSPRRVLLVGGGPRTVREVLGHHPESVIYVELDPVLIDAGRRYAPPELVRVLDDRRVRIVLGDARLHASRLAREHGPFDAILVALGDPTTAQLNRYYTLEWFRQAAGLLADGGLLGFHLMSSGDYLSDDLRSYNACVFHTARAAGLHLDVFPGLQAVFVASRTPGATVGLSDPPGALAARLRSRGLPPDLLLAAFYDALDPSRRSDRRRELEAQRDVRRNRDLTPTCYYYAQVLWASWWRDSTRGLLRSAQRLTLGHVLGLIALTAVAVGLACRLSRSPGRVAAPYALLVTGAGGMTLEVALLLGLQSLYGYVYGIVGYAVGVLMAGLAVGAWWAQRLDRVRPDAALVLTQVGLILAAAATPLGLLGLQRLAPLWASTSWLPVAAISLLMGLTGLVVGATFPCALRLAKGDAVHGATALYAIDLLGACGGALLAGLALIPLLGVAATCSAVGLAAATSALIGGVAPRKGECT